MFGRVLTGALIGAGAIAAAPFTGGGSVLAGASLVASLTGAGTVAAAVGAGAAGGVAAGVVASRRNEEKKEEGRREAGQAAEMKYKLKLEKLLSQMESLMKDVGRRDSFIVSAFAVGIACANADGHICEEELLEIDELVVGIGTSEMLGSGVKEAIQAMMDRPPTLNEAIALIEKNGFTDPNTIEIFSVLIDVTIAADGISNDAEKMFRKTWNSYAVA